MIIPVKSCNEMYSVLCDVVRRGYPHPPSSVLSEVVFTGRAAAARARRAVSWNVAVTGNPSELHPGTHLHHTRPTSGTWSVTSHQTHSEYVIQISLEHSGDFPLSIYPRQGTSGKREDDCSRNTLVNISNQLGPLLMDIYKSMEMEQQSVWTAQHSI